MANILITDLLEESAYLVRSLLRSAGHAVSISITPEDAEAKMSTGLFDLLLVDYYSVSDESLSVGKFANEMLPGLPVVALTRNENKSKLKGLQLTSQFTRPIRGREVKEAVTHALSILYKDIQRRRMPRIHTELPVSLECAGVSFDSRTIDLSDRGVAIDTANVKLTPDQIEAIETAIGSKGVVTRLTVEKNKVLSLSGRLAFVERHRGLGGRTLGIAFDNLDEQSEVALQQLYKNAA